VALDPSTLLYADLKPPAPATTCRGSPRRYCDRRRARRRPAAARTPSMPLKARSTVPSEQSSTPSILPVRRCSCVRPKRVWLCGGEAKFARSARCAAAATAPLPAQCEATSAAARTRSTNRRHPAERGRRASWRAACTPRAGRSRVADEERAVEQLDRTAVLDVQRAAAHDGGVALGRRAAGAVASSSSPSRRWATWLANPPHATCSQRQRLCRDGCTRRDRARAAGPQTDMAETHSTRKWSGTREYDAPAPR